MCPNLKKETSQVQLTLCGKVFWIMLVSKTRPGSFAWKLKNFAVTHWALGSGWQQKSLILERAFVREKHHKEELNLHRASPRVSQTTCISQCESCRFRDSVAYKCVLAVAWNASRNDVRNHTPTRLWFAFFSKHNVVRNRMQVQGQGSAKC